MKPNDPHLKFLPMLLLVVLPIMAQAIDYTYITNNNAITITGYTGTDVDITLPSKITGLPVTTIGQVAFSGSVLISVKIPNSITTIKAGAFQNCTHLVSVEIPNTVSVIEAYTLAGCSSLTSLTIPNSITEISQEALFSCSNLENIVIGTGLKTFESTVIQIIDGSPILNGCSSLATFMVDKHNPYFSSVDGVLLNKDQTELIICPVGKEGGYTLPDSVSNIGERAFSECRGLTNITLPDSLISIEGSAFQSCSGLTNAMIPDSVIFIGHGAFKSCTGLTSLTIPDSLQSIPAGMFEFCTSLTNVELPDSVTHIEFFAFTGCSALRRVGIPSNVVNIGRAAFADCSNLTSLFFKGNAPVIGEGSSEDSGSLFFNSPDVVSYYQPGATGWDSSFGERPTVLWNPDVLTQGTDFGVQTNGFCFSITGATNLPVVIDATVSLSNPAWNTLQDGVLTNGSILFRDEQWTNFPIRFYRVRMP